MKNAVVTSPGAVTSQELSDVTVSRLEGYLATVAIGDILPDLRTSRGHYYFPMFFGCSCLFLVEYGQERVGKNENIRLCFENQRSSVQRRDIESAQSVAGSGAQSIAHLLQLFFVTFCFRNATSETRTQLQSERNHGGVRKGRRLHEMFTGSLQEICAACRHGKP